LYVNNYKKKTKKSYLLLKLTYYVVSNNVTTISIFHLHPLLMGVPFIKFPKLILPKSSLNFDDASLAVKQLKDFKGKSGVYIWSHRITGRQYVGSSADLFKRLQDYFQRSQLQVQAKNSHSVICRAILKYGLSEFSLSIQETNTPKSFLELEQFYLDKYLLLFNTRRIATSAAYNPSVKLRKSVYIYDSFKKTLLAKFETINKFKTLSGLNGSQIKKLILSENKLWRNTYFLSSTLITNADNSLSKVSTFIPVEATRVKFIYPIFAYSLTGEKENKEPLIFDSQAKCIKMLGGAPQTLLKCFKNGTLFKGYKVSRIPLSDPFK